MRKNTIEIGDVVYCVYPTTGSFNYYGSKGVIISMDTQFPNCYYFRPDNNLGDFSFHKDWFRKFRKPEYLKLK